jgi:hypothetical protein
MNCFNITKIISSHEMRKFIQEMNQNTKGHIIQAQHIDRDLWLLFVRTQDRNEADYIRQNL